MFNLLQNQQCMQKQKQTGPIQARPAAKHGEHISIQNKPQWIHVSKQPLQVVELIQLKH